MNQAELRQTFNTISRNFESANEAAQENIYSFTSHYIDPCLGSIKSCVFECVAPCFPGNEDTLRRRRRLSRSGLEHDFDFYDDWEEEELGGTASGGWAHDELDSLLAGRGQPRAQQPMSYGARGRRSDPELDPTAIPKSSYLGFLERLPFKLGARVLHYRPSASGLQENPGGLRIRDVEAEPLMEGNAYDERDLQRSRGHTRTRSGTDASHSTHTSRSARSDLIMSDEEDDAQPLDDEFATVMLSRRTTGHSDDHSSGKTGSGKRPAISRDSTRNFSSRSLRSDKVRRTSSRKSSGNDQAQTPAVDVQVEPPTMIDLKREEDKLREEEETEIVQKREAATKLALAIGLSNEEIKSPPSVAVTDSHHATPNRTPSTQSIQSLAPITLADGDESGHDDEPFPELKLPERDVHRNGDPP